VQKCRKTKTRFYNSLLVAHSEGAKRFFAPQKSVLPLRSERTFYVFEEKRSFSSKNVKSTPPRKTREFFQNVDFQLFFVGVFLRSKKTLQKIAGNRHF